MIISFSQPKPDFKEITINNSAIQRIDSFKILGVILQNDLKWNQHVNTVISKANKRLYLLSHLKKAGIPTHDLLVLYNSLVIPILKYACEVYHSSLTQSLSEDLERVQKRALRCIAGKPSADYIELLNLFKLSSLEDQRISKCKKLFHEMSRPDHKLNHYLVKNEQTHNLRHKRCYIVPKCRTKRFQKTFVPWSILTFDK